jgi:hypothetical protein
VGAFYETAGVDALTLIEHGCCDNMSGEEEHLKAGFPVKNLKEVVEKLVQEQGMSVVSGPDDST